jgi:hypothetical protein
MFKAGLLRAENGDLPVQVRVPEMAMETRAEGQVVQWEHGMSAWLLNLCSKASKENPENRVLGDGERRRCHRMRRECRGGRGRGRR